MIKAKQRLSVLALAALITCGAFAMGGCSKSDDAAATSATPSVQMKAVPPGANGPTKGAAPASAAKSSF